MGSPKSGFRATVGPGPRAMAHIQDVDQSLILRPASGWEKSYEFIAHGYSKCFTSRTCKNWLLLYYYRSSFGAYRCSNPHKLPLGFCSRHNNEIRLYILHPAGRPFGSIKRCRPPRSPLFTYRAGDYLRSSFDNSASKLK
jgi:hypothetical protein